MYRKRIIALALILVLALCSVSSLVYASGHGETKRHYKKSLKEKIFHKAKFYLKNQEKLNLKEAQIEKIQSLKLQTKKDLILKGAEIEVIGIDIESKLKEDPVDIETISKLIDKKYDLKKEKTKSLVETYAALKEILTDQQKNKTKELWKSKRKSSSIHPSK